jgi:polyisoprenoid-binding protein YceI
LKPSVWVWIAVAVLVVGGSAFAYVWFSGGSGEPSTELTTPPIAEQTTTTGTPGATTTTAGSGETTTSGEGVGEFFVIQSDQSVATYTIDEVLRGQPNTVVGTTSEVAGQFSLDPADLASTEFSQFVVNARTFTSDSSTRDRAVRGPIILNSASDEFELITFDPTGVEGLEGSAAVGDTLEFVLVGDLTITGTTHEARFEITATLVDDSTVRGTAESTVLRSDYGIGIPSVASVADVPDEVILTLDFVATRS